MRQSPKQQFSSRRCNISWMLAALVAAFFHSCHIETTNYYNTACVTALSTNNAITTTTTTQAISSTSSSPILSSAHITTIANGGVAILPNFVPPTLVTKLRKDATLLQSQGHFRPDGLTNNAKGNANKQGFTKTGDRQTFRSDGQSLWFEQELGDIAARLEFEGLLSNLRQQLAVGLNRPTLVANKDSNNRHEITYNWYEPGAKLGRHLDEHHEETKGPKGWMVNTRRSVTWLLYLNKDWQANEGGSLLCHPRSNAGNNAVCNGPIGAHEGNLQIGWMDDYTPVYLDAFRDTGGTALYSIKKGNTRKYLSQRDFDVPAQPIDFARFLPESIQPNFEQISTVAKDPRFASSAVASNTASTTTIDNTSDDGSLEITPYGGTLVLFDSVTLPHSVLPVTGTRQRIAATGWFHEDSQFVAI